jgi:hypothetical protein
MQEKLGDAWKAYFVDIEPTRFWVIAFYNTANEKVPAHYAQGLFTNLAN